MIKSAILALFLCLFNFNSANAEILTLNQILESTCRVQAGDFFGTGSCIKYANNKYYILTNAHVVNNSKTAKVEFFKGGKKTLPLPAKVIWVRYQDETEIDLAILEVEAKYFGQYPPRIAKLAPRNAAAVGGYIITAGCPGARWPSALEGFLLDSDNQLVFYPPPIGGQSGSGLYIVCKEGDTYNTYLKGVVTWRIGNVPGETMSSGYENSHGGAVSIDTFYDIIKGTVSKKNISIPDNYEQVQYRERRFPRLVPIPEEDPVPEVPEEIIPEDNPYQELPDFLTPLEKKLDRTEYLLSSGFSQEEAQKQFMELSALSDKDFKSKVDSLVQEKIEQEKEAALAKEKEAAKQAKELEKAQNTIEELKNEDNTSTWVGLGISGLISNVLTYFAAKGKLTFKKIAKEKIDEIQDSIDSKLEPVIGKDKVDLIRHKTDGLEALIESRIDAIIAKKIPSLPEVGEDSTLLEEVTKSVVSSIKTDEFKSRLNKDIAKLLKGDK